MLRRSLSPLTGYTERLAKIPACASQPRPTRRAFRRGRGSGWRKSLHAQASRARPVGHSDAAAVQPPGTSLVNSAGMFASGRPAMIFSSSCRHSSSQPRMSSLEVSIIAPPMIPSASLRAPLALPNEVGSLTYDLLRIFIRRRHWLLLRRIRAPTGLGRLDVNLATKLLATAVILFGWLRKRSPANMRTCGGADCSARRRLSRSSRSRVLSDWRLEPRD